MRQLLHGSRKSAYDANNGGAIGARKLLGTRQHIEFPRLHRGTRSAPSCCSCGDAGRKDRILSVAWRITKMIRLNAGADDTRVGISGCGLLEAASIPGFIGHGPTAA